MSWFAITVPAKIGNAHFINPNQAFTLCALPFTKDMRLTARPKRKCPICIERRKAR